MRSRTFVVCTCALLLAWGAAAQEHRGIIDGVVKDTSGALLPGVVIQARSATGAIVATSSDATGAFRFPSLQPGIYDVTARLIGFTDVADRRLPPARAQADQEPASAVQRQCTKPVQPA